LFAPSPFSQEGLTMTAEEIEKRLNVLERIMATASIKDLPALNATYQKLMDKLVQIDLKK
jgi:hypothetical protein